MTTMWQYTVNYSDVTAKGAINGFPIIEIDSAEGGFDTGPLNPALIGKGNVLRIEVTRKGAEGSLEGKVDAVAQGEMVDTGTGGDFKLPDGDTPLVIEHTFDSEFDGFAKVLDGLQPSDPDTMKAFALTVRDTLNSGDQQAILALFKPKFEHLAEAMGVPMEVMMGQVEGLAGAFGGGNIQFDESDVVMDPCCDNKLFRLRHKDGKQLIRIIEDDGSMQLDLAAGLTADGPAIVM